MNGHDLRALFQTFAGHEKFGKFVNQVFRDLQTGHELRQWQQKIWTDFHEAHPDVPTDPDVIRAAFAWCLIHHQSLTPLSDLNLCSQDVQQGFAAAREREFPFCYGKWVCLECIAARDQWI